MKRGMFAGLMAMVAIFSLLSFTVVIFFFNPQEADNAVRALFFLALFFMLSAVYVLLEIAWRRRAEMFSPRHVFLRGLAFAGAVVGALVLIKSI